MRVLPLAVAATVLGACVATPAPSQSSGPVAPVTSVEPPSSTPAPSTPSPSPTPTPSPSSTGVVASGTGLGGVRFGTPAAAAEKQLVALLGPVTNRTAGVECSILPDSPPTLSVAWGSVQATMGVGESGKTGDPLVFETWHIAVTQLPKSTPLRLPLGGSLRTTWPVLHAAYPAATKLDGQGIEGDTTLVSFPDGMQAVLGPTGQTEFWSAGLSMACE